MPELPEVETTLAGIKPYVVKQTLQKILVRHPQLRWPIPRNISKVTARQPIIDATRRGKYLLLHLANGTLILHLGMSGSLRIIKKPTPPQKHDHVDILLENGTCLRFRDPRRFGALLWTQNNPEEHILLAHLGPEPLEETFHSNYLWEKSRQRKVPIKSFIMDSKIVVGVGNIYANEALFSAGIHPQKAAGKISLEQCHLLAKAIKRILKSAIKQGGTTLQDFVDSEGKKGYFSVHLQVYGRGGEPCTACKNTLKEIRLGQRSTVYCEHCQQ